MTSQQIAELLILLRDIAASLRRIEALLTRPTTEIEWAEPPRSG
jgi:hypothetical protein